MHPSLYGSKRVKGPSQCIDCVVDTRDHIADNNMYTHLAFKQQHGLFLHTPLSCSGNQSAPLNFTLFS
ncbi:hypothetical protein XELAEV_18041331mg [Xenopus laevis]|uniref:Uncharacterized protein n=1 Tax=Xenopus laevis TaxID=8355 RepID=A0A974H506_XENLA|nr:hypothetical protein XELAEV_18041331mg [Xenopus laevis]